MNKNFEEFKKQWIEESGFEKESDLFSVTGKWFIQDLLDFAHDCYKEGYMEGYNKGIIIGCNTNSQD